MSAKPQPFKIKTGAHESSSVPESDFARLGWQERDVQEWVAANPSSLEDGLLIVAKEYSRFDKTKERIDLLAVHKDGSLVVIELKRDDTGADAHWQAIKYASYLRKASAEDIVGMLASYQGMQKEEAKNKLLDHLDAENLNGLNNNQRVVLVSHRFAPEVTSAALWLNERAHGDNLITCVELTPYQYEQTNSLQIVAHKIIPMPDENDLIVMPTQDTDGQPKQRRGGHSHKGATPTASFRQPIIDVLKRRGGKALAKDVLSDLEKEMDLSRDDLKKGHTGEVDWKHNVRWMVTRLRDEHKLKRPRDSGRGWWELA